MTHWLFWALFDWRLLILLLVYSGLLKQITKSTNSFTNAKFSISLRSIAIRAIDMVKSYDSVQLTIALHNLNKLEITSDWNTLCLLFFWEYWFLVLLQFRSPFWTKNFIRSNQSDVYQTCNPNRSQESDDYHNHHPNGSIWVMIIIIITLFSVMFALKHHSNQWCLLSSKHPSKKGLSSSSSSHHCHHPY